MRRLFKRIGSLLGGRSQAEASQPSPHIEKTLQIIEHVRKNLGPIYSTVTFDMLDILEPLTIIIVEPNEKNDFYILITSGMSYKGMVVPKDLDNTLPYCSELVLRLPATWKAPRNEDDIENLEDKDQWPLRFLLDLAEYPHRHQTWLWLGHSVPLASAYKGFTHTMIDHDFLNAEFSFIAQDNNAIFFHGVYPITPSELEFKKKNGSDALMDWLSENDVSLVFNPDKTRVIVGAN